jgi:hypothetical protein
VLLAASLIAAVPIALGAARTSAAAATPSARVVLSAPPILQLGARVVGAVAPSTRIQLDVALNVRDPAKLQAMLAGMYDRRSPLFHHFLARGQFAVLFGATNGEIAAVESWLRSVGITPTGLAANRLTVRATGTVGVTARALRTTFAAVRVAGGGVDFVNRTSPSVPAAVAPYVQGVIGLDNLPAVHSNLAPATPGLRVSSVSRTSRTSHAAGPSACTSLASAASYQGSFTAAGLASYYSMAPLYTLGDNGQGVRIAIAEFEPNLRSDLAWFEHCYKASNVVNYMHVDGGSGPAGPGSGEAVLDIENVISLAPRATIDVYQTPNTDQGAIDLYNAMVSSDVDKVISTSWGSCELHTNSPVLTAEATTFTQASAQGQVVFAAAGDSGSTDCYGDMTGLDQSALTVDDPGSQPYVLSVGGTTATAHAEVVWNDTSSGGGGGVSSHCMPAYQHNVAVPGLFNAGSVTNAMCVSGYDRQVPDVTAIADPNTGYTVYFDGSLTAIGGTSGAAPLWAAAAALVLVSPYCAYDHATVGVSPQSLYSLAATPMYSRGLRDITSGSNAVSASGYGGSLFPALAGFDEASGLGSPTLTYPSRSLATSLFQPGLASLLCYAQGSVVAAPVVSGVAPATAASTAPTTITVLGTGFIPISGAVRVAIDGRSFPATCTTSTHCTVILNGLAPGVADLRVLDQIYAESTVTSADQVTILASPKVTSISPNKGPASGRTRVTIRGTGFTGRVSVHFGTRLATYVTVVSPTKVVVSAPAGTGSVYVKVTAAGGVSARSPAVLYRY